MSIMVFFVSMQGPCEVLYMMTILKLPLYSAFRNIDLKAVILNSSFSPSTTISLDCIVQPVGIILLIHGWEGLNWHQNSFYAGFPHVTDDSGTE